jgi:hypothetical protein
MLTDILFLFDIKNGKNTEGALFVIFVKRNVVPFCVALYFKRNNIPFEVNGITFRFTVKILRGTKIFLRPP